MKKNFILDMIIYLAIPILLCRFINVKTMGYIMIFLVSIIFIYTLITRKKEFRVNKSAIVFSCIYIYLSLVKQNAESNFIIYVYDTYSLIIISTVFIVFKFFNVNIVKQIYKDVLNANRYTRNYIYNILRKDNIVFEFEKILSVINIHLLSMSFIKVYSIINYGEKEYTITSDLEMLVCVIFIIIEIYMIYKINKTYKIGENQKNKGKSKNREYINIKSIKKDDKKKVIYINEYKKTNK